MAILAALSHQGVARAQNKTATATNLSLTSGGNVVTTVSPGSVVRLTATVTTGALGVTPGQVNFCDASAPLCTDIHLLGTAQLTNAGTAAIQFRPGIGTHSYKAVYAGTNSYASSSSNPSALQVTGTIGVLPTATAIDQSGSWGAYTLSATVTEVGGILPLTGGVSFLDASNGNAVLKTAPLGSSVAGLAWPTPQTLSLDYQARAVSVGDFNADGIPDLLLAAGNSIQSLLILLRNADGTYTKLQSSAISAYSINWIEVADFNNDGRQDLAVLNGDNNTLAILLGNGDGTFVAVPSSSSTAGSSRKLAIADFNGDGLIDVAVVSLSNVVTVYLGVGDGTFTTVPGTTSINGLATSIVTGDFNGDGKVDLALTEANDDAIWILQGNGNGTFAATNSLHSGNNGSPVAVGDFNGDGKLDLVAGYQAANGSGDWLNLITGNGDGTFNSVPLSQSTNTISISSVLTGDFNADGIPDAVLMDQTSGCFVVFLGDGSGAFTKRSQSASLGANFYFLYALADFNGDGRADLTVSNNYSSYPMAATIYFTSPTQTASTAAAISLPVAGQHLVGASYSGDANYTPSTSGTLPLWGVPPVTTTTLTLTSGGFPVSSVAYGTAVTLTATLTQATAGQVNFCDASAIFCTDVHVIGSATLTSNGIASFTFVPGAGAHSYRAVFVLNGSGQGSTSNPVSLTVGSAPPPVYTDAAAISYADLPGAYSLTGTVTGYGGPSPPTGQVSFIDTSFGNNVLGTAPLGSSTAGLGWRIAQWPITGNYPISEVAADLNGDGVPDLALVWTGSTQGTTLLGNGDGTFSSGTSFSALPSSQTVTNSIADDFNEDGRTDLAILSYDSSFHSNVTTILGNGDGTFGNPQTSAAYSQPSTGGTFYGGAMARADFDGDGKLDLALSGDCITSCGITILMGNGNGTFKAATTFWPEQNLHLGAIGDFNGDSIPDLIVSPPSSGGTSQIMTLLGKGDGTFSVSASVITLSTMLSSVVLDGDFNSDGKLDLAFGKVFNGGEYDTFIYFGNGDGTFAAAPGSPLSGAGNYLLAGDFNHDGKLDLAGLDDPTGSGTVYISIYAGAGDGTFTRKTTSPSIGSTSAYSRSLVSADFNGDGASDLAMTSFNVQVASILLGVPTHSASATISNVAPIGANTHNVDASYSGDSNYGAAVSGTVALQAGLAPLVITPPSGNYTSPQTVTISESIPGASIYYTLLGSGAQSVPITPYTGPIVLDHGGFTSIRAMVSESGYYQANDAFAYYALTLPVVPTPVITPVSGSYPGTQTVTITDSMPGTAIYYRTDGGAPTLNSTVYTGPFTVSKATTITAVAEASGYSSSALANSQILIGNSQSRLIYTIAGNTGWGYSGDGGLATAATLDYPLGTAVDSAGNIYFSEQGNHRVRKIAAGTGVISTVAGTGVAGYGGDNGPAVNAQLNYPGALALDGAGNLYVAEGRNFDVREVSASTGIITTVAGNPTATNVGDGGPATSAQLRSPWGLAVDNSGNLYIADFSRIRKVSGGIITTIAGTGISGNAGDNGPAISAQIYNAAGIALDAASNLYIADVGRNVIRKITASTGIISTIAGNGTLGYGGDGGPAANSFLRNPNFVAVDSAGNIYIADTGNSVVREITASDGYINTIAGSYGNCTSVAGDGGPALGAAICSPEGLSLDNAGNLIVAESSHRIRMVTAPISPPTATTATPVFSVSGGTYGSTQQVVISDTTPGAEIYVSLNGVPVTTAAAAYRGTIQVTGSATLQAIAVAPGYLPSAPAVATYTITTPPTAVIETIAGNGMYGGTAGGGAATSTPLSTPNGVAVDSRGNVYIADGSNYVVWKVDGGTGTISVAAGQLKVGGFSRTGDGGPATSAILSSISDVAIDSADNLYISDTGFSVIRKVDHNTGIISTFAGTGQASSLTLDGSLAVYANLSSPRGIAFDSAGNLYIADYGFNRVRVVSAATGIITTIAGNGSASGISGDGGVATAASIAAPTDVALDRAGNLYIADGGYVRIRKVNLNTGVISTLAGNGNRGATGDGKQATAAEISPSGLAVDGAGNVYLSNPNDGIRMVPAGGGIITTVVGNGYPGFGGDGGAATMAEVSAAGLAFDKSGSLYIADLGNGRVRKVTYTVATAVPSFSLAAGTYSGTQTVSITDGTPGAMIYYTTDGSTPSTGSTLYTGPISVASTTTLQAIAVGSGFAASAIASATYTISTATAPTISWPTSAVTTYGTPLGSAQLSATTTVPGTFVYSPTVGSMLNAGQQTLSVTFTPTDIVHYSIATASVVLTVNKAPLTVVVNNASMTYGGTLPTFTGSVSGVVPGDGITASYATNATTSSSAGLYPITATLNDPSSKLINYVVTNTSGALTIGRATSNVVWATPSVIVYGTPLNVVQLNALADVPGSFVYSPSDGTVLSAGTQILSVTWIPTDSVDYAPVTKTVQLSVNKAPLSVRANDASINYGGILPTFSGTLTGVVVGDAITASYLSAAASSSTVGSYPITAVLNDPGSKLSNYAVTNTSGNLTIMKATPLISWPAPLSIAFGTALSAVQLNAGSTTSGTFVYTPASGTVLSVGLHTLTLNFSPADAVDYNVAIASVSLSVTAAVPSISAVGSSSNPSLISTSITFTATVTAAGGAPTGTVTFKDGTTQLASVAVNAGVATYSTSSLPTGAHSITAVYSGDANFASVTSSALTQIVESYSIGAGGGSSTVSATPGGQATFTLLVTPPSVGSALTFSVSGLPSGATATFSPSTVAAGSAPTNVTLTISVPTTATAQPIERPFRGGGLPIALGLILLPLAGRLRSVSRTLRSFAALCLIGFMVSTGTIACGGGGSGGGGSKTPTPRTYTLTVTAVSGSLTQTTILTLNVG